MLCASQGKLMSAGGRRGRHPRKVRRAASRYTTKSPGDSESPCGVPTVVLNRADSATSTLTVHECKTLRSFSRRIVSNARERSIPSISTTYLYRWHLATSHRRNPLWDGERKSSTLSEIRCSMLRDNVLRRVDSSSTGLKIFSG